MRSIWTVSRKAVWKGGFINKYFQIIETSANGRLKLDLERIEANNAEIAKGGHREFGRPIKVEIASRGSAAPLSDYSPAPILRLRWSRVLPTHERGSTHREFR
jgi:hypothetical protein